MEEEGIEFEIGEKVFYNPQMHFCRSFFSLAVGALNKKIKICDAFSASGIRGIRYAKENKNVEKSYFVDIDKAAIYCTKKNIQKNKVRGEVRHGNFSKLVFDIVADFLEIDPFGSPVPYLYDSLRVFNPLKSAYLSVTATDTPVLCGGKEKACMKNYHSKPMNNEFTHETGLRILLKKIAETAAEFNFGIEPLVSLSDRHYLKVLVKLNRSAEAAYESLAKLGFVNYCSSCGFRGSSKFPREKCGNCDGNLAYAGPLWLGEIHQLSHIKNMIKLNKKRNYTHKAEIEKKLSLMLGEIGMPPYYYNLHKLCGRFGREVPKIEDFVNLLNKKGFKASRTHFSNISIKTNASVGELASFLSKKPSNA